MQVPQAGEPWSIDTEGGNRFQVSSDTLTLQVGSRMVKLALSGTSASPSSGRRRLQQQAHRGPSELQRARLRTLRSQERGLQAATEVRASSGSLYSCQGFSQHSAGCSHKRVGGPPSLSVIVHNVHTAESGCKEVRPLQQGRGALQRECQGAASWRSAA